MKKYTLDAQGKRVGRIASEAAKLLMGKDSADYARNIVPNVEVEIINASKASVDQRKMGVELKARYSRYPSGIVTPTIGQIIEKKGKKELFRRAVYGMLPTNKLRSRMIKNLKISE